MTIFEYFLVLFSVILSLTLTQLAAGVGELVRSRQRVIWSLPFLLWVLVIAQTVIDLWSSAWLMRDMTRFHMVQVVFLLVTALASYLAALWLIPAQAGEARIDLYRHMVDQRRYFLGAYLVYLVSGVGWNLALLPPGQFDLVNYVIAAPAIATLIVAWIWPARAVQVTAPIISSLLLLAYWFFFFPSIE